MAKEETKIDMGIEMTKLWYKDVMGNRAAVVKYRDPFGADPLMQSPTPDEDAPIYVALDGRQPELLINALQELERYRTQNSMQVQDRLKQADELLEKMRVLYENAEYQIKPIVIKKRWWNRSR